MKIHHCSEHQQETRAVPASTVCLQALSRALWQPVAQVWGLGSGGKLSSFTIDRRIVSGGSKSLPERRGMQFLESPQMQAHLYWPVCVLQVPSPGGRSGGWVAAACPAHGYPGEAARAILQEEIQPPDLWCCQIGSVLCGQEEGSVIGANSDKGEKGCGHSEAHIKWREDLRLDSP